MLGIAFKSNVNEHKVDMHTCRFYDWRTRECYSSEFAAPRWLKWSRDGNICALAYPSHVLICDAVEQFMPIASVPIFEGISGAWENCQFYVTTPKTIECIVVPEITVSSEKKPHRSVQASNDCGCLDFPSALRATNARSESHLCSKKCPAA